MNNYYSLKARVSASHWVILTRHNESAITSS